MNRSKLHQIGRHVFFSRSVGLVCPYENFRFRRRMLNTFAFFTLFSCFLLNVYGPTHAEGLSNKPSLYRLATSKAEVGANLALAHASLEDCFVRWKHSRATGSNGEVSDCPSESSFAKAFAIQVLLQKRLLDEEILLRWRRGAGIPELPTRKLSPQ